MNKFKYRYISLMVILFIVSMVAFANSASPQMDPITGRVWFDEASGIALESEVINLNFAKDREDSIFAIEYNLKNTTDKVLTLPIWFISQDKAHDEGEKERFSVYEGEFKHDVKSVDVVDIENWEHNDNRTYINPYNGKVIKEHDSWYNTNGRHFHEFTLVFQPGESKKLDINYLSRNGYISYDRNHFGRYLTQLYYISPAKFYEGNVEIRMNVTIPRNHKFASNFQFEKIDNTHYTSHLSQIPNGEVTFTIIDKRGKFFGTNSTTIHNLLYAIVLLAVCYILRVLYVKWGRKLYVKDGFLLLLLMLAILGFEVASPYGVTMMFFILFYNPFAAGVFFFFLLIRLRQYYRYYLKETEDHELR